MMLDDIIERTYLKEIRAKINRGTEKALNQIRLDKIPLMWKTIATQLIQSQATLCGETALLQTNSLTKQQKD